MTPVAQPGPFLFTLRQTTVEPERGMLQEDGSLSKAPFQSPFLFGGLHIPRSHLIHPHRDIRRSNGPPFVSLKTIHLEASAP